MEVLDRKEAPERCGRRILLDVRAQPRCQLLVVTDEERPLALTSVSSRRRSAAFEMSGPIGRKTRNFGIKQSFKSIRYCSCRSGLAPFAESVHAVYAASIACAIMGRCLREITIALSPCGGGDPS